MLSRHCFIFVLFFFSFVLFRSCLRRRASDSRLAFTLSSDWNNDTTDNVMRFPMASLLSLLLLICFSSPYSVAWVPTTTRHATSRFPPSLKCWQTKKNSGARALYAHSSLREQPGSSSGKEPWRVAQTMLMAALIWIGAMFRPLASSAEESDSSSKMRYWSIMKDGPPDLVIAANQALLDHAVGTVNTMYYDNSGGAFFAPRDFYSRWKELRESARSPQSKITHRKAIPNIPSDISFDSREGAVKGLKWIISSLNDPFSKYLTREELRQELQDKNNGFLGLGAMVESPQENVHPTNFVFLPPSAPRMGQVTTSMSKDLLSYTQIANLPVVTAVSPDSPAERAGIVVGDRIVAVGSDKFLGQTRSAVTRALQTRYHAENYIGYPDMTVAKPRLVQLDDENVVTAGYRLSRVRLPTTLMEPFHLHQTIDGSVFSGGDAIVHYELLTPQDSIFDRTGSSAPVGYIRLTRFSRASTAGYLKAVSELDAAGAQSYIIDLRNNYGGIVQEAMLTASSLLRDPHAVLCYTMNSRGAFTPHDVEEYVVDTRYPGYLLSSEPKSVTLNQVKREDPSIFDKNGVMWVPPSSYASLHEQTMKRGIRRSKSATVGINPAKQWNAAFSIPTTQEYQLRAQKKIILLINEGTASSAEVFASALHDNGRTVALVGAKTYGKGLIQHTFPMPDGGGLRLTVAEYLTPSLKHVTNVGSARFDRSTGEWVGGGIKPDIICESKGIPSNIGADLCVGVALDALENGQDVPSGFPGGSI